MKKPITQFLQIIFFPVIILLGVWVICASLIKSVLILPGPLEVFQRFFNLWSEAKFRVDILATVLRSIFSFSLSLLISFLLGFFAAFHSKVDNFIKFPLAIIKATPVVSFILLAIFWFTTNMVPVFVSVLMSLPVMTTAIYTGLKNVDSKLLIMSDAYGFTKKQKLRYLYLPTMVPFFFSGALSSFGISWKAVVAAEVICLPKYAAGTAMQRAKVHLETSDVFAITIVIIIISFALETVLAFLAKRWSRKYAG